MSVKGMEFEGLLLRSKVPIPFVEENFYLPQKVFVEGYFPIGTIFKFRAVETEEEQKIIFHVDLSALFLLLDPIDETGNIIKL